MRATAMIETDFGNEIVAMDLKTGDCFGFNEVAASVWRILATPKSAEQLREALLAEYDVGAEQCAIELDALVADLVEKKLIVACA